MVSRQSVASVSLCLALAVVVLASSRAAFGQRPRGESDEHRITELAADLNADDDPELGALRRALASLPGRIALDEQLAELEKRDREEAPRRALEVLVARHFVEDESGYRLRPDREGLEAWVGNQCDQREADLGVVAAAIAAVRQGLAGDGALDGALRAFLARDDAAALIYSEMLRPRLRPDRMAQTLAWVLVPGDDSRCRVPARFASRAETLLARYRDRRAALDTLRRGLDRIAGELDPEESLSQRLAVHLRDELGAIEWLLERIARVDDPAAEVKFILRRTEDVLPKSTRGRRAWGEERKILSRSIRFLEIRRWDLEWMLATARRVASELAPGAANDAWREILGTNTALLLVSRPRKAAKPEARKILWDRTPFGRTLVAGEGGAFRIHRHFRYEVEQWTRELLDAARERATLDAAIATFASRLADAKLRARLSAPAGRDLLRQWSRHIVEPADAEKLDRWIARGLRTTPRGRVLTPDGREACRRLVERARVIEGELAAAGSPTALSLRKLDLRSEGLELLRSSAFYNPRTAAGAYYYDAFFPDHFAARLFGSFGWDLRSAKSEKEYLERVRKRVPALQRLSRSHRKLILRIAGTPPWLSSSNDPGSFEPKGGYKNKSTHPPRDYAVWTRLVRETVKQCRELPVERYYEIWNEPDGMYWQSGMKELIELYARTARAIREVDPEAKVGGLAVNQWDRGLKRDPEAGPITLALIRAAGKQGFPLDFISWHHFGRPIAAIQEAKDTYLAECRRVRLTKMPELLVTEWSTPGRGSPFAAPWLGRMLLGFWEAGVDVQTIAAWEEFHARPDYRGYAPWGIITQQGARKNTWHVHRYFDRLSRDSRGVAVVPIDAQRTLVLSRKEEHTWELVILNMASPSRFVAARKALREAGIEDQELAPYQTYAQLERAIAAGQSRDPRHAPAFRAAQRAWKEHPVQTERLHLVIENAQHLEALEAESVRMSNGAKRVTSLGNALSCDLAGQEVVRLLLRVR